MKKQSFWKRLSDYGTDSLATIPERKRHRIANQLLIAVVLINLLFGALELVVYALLLSKDYERYFHYLYFYTIPGLVVHGFAALTYYLKNRTQNMNWAFLIVAPLVGYITMFCFYLGEPLMIHLILFALLPIPFFIYARGQLLQIVLHELIILAGIVAALASYHYLKPLLPVTPDLEQVLQSVPVITVVGVLCLISYYHWRQTTFSDELLQEEKKQVEDLLGNIIPRHEQAEKKYRHLVEGSHDIIFSMAPDGTIKTVNNAIRSHPGFSPAEIQGQKFESLIFGAPDGHAEIEINLFRSYVHELPETGKALSFRVPLRQKYHHEPAELSVTLELAESDNETEILGKATSVQNDLILNFLQRERGRYTIGNSISHAEILSHKLTRNLGKVLPATDVQALRISLREMLINAIEHGNLGVTYEEKTQAQQEGDFLAFLRQRQQDPRYAERKVFVDYLFDQNKVAYQITDEGAGFDHALVLADDSDAANEGFLAHGRGITMTRSIFNHVRYNDAGNRVILVKHLTSDVAVSESALAS